MENIFYTIYNAIIKLITDLMTLLGANTDKIPGYLTPEEAPEETPEA